MKQGAEIEMVDYGVVEYKEIKHAALDIMSGLSFEELKSNAGYKETLVTWLNPDCQIISNDDIPISEDIALALDLIQEMVRRARVDRSVDELSVWMRQRQEKDPHRIGNGRKSKIFTSLL